MEAPNSRLSSWRFPTAAGTARKEPRIQSAIMRDVLEWLGRAYEAV
jgi:hypothetical protein